MHRFLCYTPRMSDAPEPAVETPVYNDEDLVYVDPLARVVVGRVEFLANGKPKSLPMKDASASEEEEEGGQKDAKGKIRKRRQRNYPWGTYRSMKRIYKLEGKPPKGPESTATLDDVIEKALKEPFWD